MNIITDRYCVAFNVYFGLTVRLLGPKGFRMTVGKFEAHQLGLPYVWNFPHFRNFISVFGILKRKISKKWEKVKQFIKRYIIIKMG